MDNEKEIGFEDWIKEGIKLFGENRDDWKFKCPSCGFVASIADYKKANAPAGAFGFSCIGRWTGSRKEIFDKTGGPCNYAGSGLFQINPVHVKKDGEIFAFFEFAVQ